jgi:hypothetical protein
LEANTNTNHMLQQLATDRGFMTPDMKAVWDDAKAARRDLQASRKRAKKGRFGELRRLYLSQLSRQALRRSDR